MRNIICQADLEIVMKPGYAKLAMEKGLGVISRGKGRITLMVLLLLSMLTA